MCLHNFLCFLTANNEVGTDEEQFMSKLFMWIAVLFIIWLLIAWAQIKWSSMASVPLIKKAPNCVPVSYLSLKSYFGPLLSSCALGSVVHLNHISSLALCWAWSSMPIQHLTWAFQWSPSQNWKGGFRTRIEHPHYHRSGRIIDVHVHVCGNLADFVIISLYICDFFTLFIF